MWVRVCHFGERPFKLTLNESVLYVCCVEFAYVGGIIWLKPFVTVLFNMCSTVTVEWCVFTRVVWRCLVCLLLCKVEGSSLVS